MYSMHVSGSVSGLYSSTRLTIHLHPHFQALPQPTELAAVAVVFVDDAILVAAATVGEVLSDTPLEEAFTTLTADCPIVSPWRKQEL